MGPGSRATTDRMPDIGEATLEFDFEKSLKPSAPSRMPKFTEVDRFINRPIAAVLLSAGLAAIVLPPLISLMKRYFKSQP